MADNTNMTNMDIIPVDTVPEGHPLPQPITEAPASLLSRMNTIQLEHDVVEYCEQLYELATGSRDREREIRETKRSMEYLEGKQWGDRARYGRNRPVLNKVRRHFWDQVGLLTDLSLTYTIKMFNKLDGGKGPNPKDVDYSYLEKLLNDLTCHWAMRHEFTDNLYDIILYGLLHTGPAKIQWNSTLAGGLGDVDVIPIAPWQWATIGAGRRVQDAECVLYFPVVTREAIARRYGKNLASRVDYDMEIDSSLQGQLQRPSNIDKGYWASMGPGMRQALGIHQSGSAASLSLFPLALCKEFWMRDASINESSESVMVGGNVRERNWAYIVEPGMPLYPRGRVVVEAGKAVLEDSPNPYWHAQFPFPVFRPFRLPWKMSGDSMLRSWMQMNTVINTIMGGMLDYLQSVNEPTLVAPAAAFPAGDWDALDPGAPGGKIRYNNNAPKAPEFAKHAEVPVAANLQYVAEVNKEFDMSSGASAMQSALNKKQVPGGDSLEMILSSRSLPVKVESLSLASFIEEAGQMVTSNILQFYSARHRAEILGVKGITTSDFRPIYGSTIPDGIAPEKYVRQFQGVIRRDTMLTSQLNEKRQIAMAMNKAGKLSDQMLFRILDQNVDFEQNKKELVDEALLKMRVAAAGQVMQGKTGGKAGGKK